MVENAQGMIEGTRRRISLGCRVALGIVAVSLIVIMVISQQMISAQMDDMTIIHTAGRQRMLSQRIALLIHDMAETPVSARGDTAGELQERIADMEQSHQMLVRDATLTKNLPGISEALQNIYFSPPLQLDTQVKNYLFRAHRVLELPARDVSLTQPDVAELLKLAHGPFLDSLGAVLKIYLKETVGRFDRLYGIIIGLSLFSLLALASVALFVLKPAIAYVAQAQRRLVELNRLKGDFLANMSHEIRTPMNGIFGTTELLLDSDLTPRQQHYVRTLQNSADHLLGLINDILDFSKLEAGQMKLDPLRFNLLATIEDVTELLSSRAREKNLELLLRYMPGTPRFVVADPGRIRQVLFNLVGNAIKFTDTGYVMVHVETVSLSQAPDARLWLRLRVEDTGIGIPEDKISSLFEKFMQVESGSTRARQGTGLGLAICRNLVRLMDGEIVVESQPGKGTVFTCNIPLEGADEPQPAIDRNTTLAGKRMLFVDDLGPNRILYKESLTMAGVQCLLAENAEEALSILAYQHDSGHTLHAIITDYMMPGVDGCKLTRKIKSDARFSHLPVIILTSAGEQGLIRQFDEAGASACLAKPTTRQQLFDTLAHVLWATARGEKQSIITAETSAAISAKRLLSREKPLAGTRILLVEDNRVNMEITMEMLQQFGCEVTPAETGERAIGAVREHHFDLIFMDCQMPEMDGFEAARHIVELKAAQQIAPVPIVALTANALKGDRERCLESGMDDYLSKPLRKANLEAILLKWLREKLENPVISVNRDELSGAAQLAAAAVPSDIGIDKVAFHSAQSLLGNKFATIISYYLEDAEGYINRIADACSRSDPLGAVTPAHTLKSSSRQLGVTVLADLAARAEEAARSLAKGEQAEDITVFLPAMRDALQHVRPFFTSSNTAA